MAESTLSITRDDIKRHLGRYLGVNRDSASWDSNTTSDVSDIILSGERNFYQPVSGYIWSFLTPILETTLTAPYTTGTITVTNGAVAGDGTTFPTWSAEGVLVFNGAHYNVSTYTNGTTLQLEDTVIDAAANTTYELRRLQYTLGDDFGGFVDPYLSFSVDNEMWYPVKITSPEQILSMRQTDDYWSGEQPLFVAPVSIAYTSATSAGQRWGMMIHPAASSAGVISGKYYSIPSKIGDGAYYPLGGQPHAETLLQSCLAAAERLMNDDRGIHQAQFEQRLAASVKLDKDLTTTKLFGYNGDKSSWNPPITRHRGDYVTYNDVLYSG